MIESTEWRGRYVGFWHIHPPRLSSRGFESGIEPSHEDLRNAVELGQFLTFVFQPDGFDAYDSLCSGVGRCPEPRPSPGGALSLARVEDSFRKRGAREARRLSVSRWLYWPR